MKKVFVLTAVLFFTATAYFTLSAGDKLTLKFKANEKWISEETSQIKGMQPPVSRSTNENTVIKVFPDGAALIMTKAVKVEAGESVDKLAPFAKSPLLNKEVYKLITADGNIYIPRPKPVFDNPEEQAASQEFGFVDEIELLKKSKTTAEFLKKNSNPMDSYLLPPKSMNLGDKVKIEGWSLTRIKDDMDCVVFESKMSSMVKTVYVDARGGACFIMLVKTKQGADMEMTYKRIK